MARYFHSHFVLEYPRYVIRCVVGVLQIIIFGMPYVYIWAMQNELLKYRNTSKYQINLNQLRSL
jgi:hypothetical protein